MLLLGVYVLLELSLEVVIPFPGQVIGVLEVVDLVICGVYLVDWVVYFVRARDRRSYLRSRILDLVASLPFVQILRPLRVFRVVGLLVV